MAAKTPLLAVGAPRDGAACACGCLSVFAACNMHHRWLMATCLLCTRAMRLVTNGVVVA